ncbi:MAG TPA: methyltransferase domain-containing protein [bacterium]|nr:methyltransferase domain-containing protein [bacterium]
MTRPEQPPRFWLDFLAWQADQTKRTRRYLARRAALREGLAVEVACGTGLVLSELKSTRPGLKAVGLDVDPLILREADPEISRVAGLAEALPFADGCAAAVIFHLGLMWVRPAEALAEAERVLKRGGHLILAAEPDYAGMLIHPEPDGRTPMAEKLARGIQRAGGDPYIGRRLPVLVDSAGLKILEYGLASRPWRYGREDLEELDRVFGFRREIHPRSGGVWWTNARRAARHGSYVEFLPVFYLLAVKR